MTISGVSYVRAKLMFGQQFVSTSQFPNIDKSKVESILKEQRNFSGTIKEIPKFIVRAFSEKTLVISGDSMYLDNCTLKGNIIIKAEKGITIGRNCRIEDAIILAPSIRFVSGFQGELQAFAENEMIIEPEVKLGYPSVIGILRGANNLQNQAMLKIETRSVIEGTVIAWQDKSNKKPILATIESRAFIRGQLFIDGLLELKGIVHGNVTTQGFFLRAGGGFYESVLMDGTIDRTQLSSFYLSPLLFDEKQRVKVVKWLE